MALTDTDLAMLELERSWFTFAATKDEAIAERFGMTTTAYYRALNKLIDRPDAVAADPLTVRRLVRMRDRRRAERVARRVM
ncbi:DUF3263 domain-containing protein [Nocardioides bizhenqiangii]|uniref:DUF3263 domain-containing protein n=1 Tax=Nocardioides bizhenqiangii TaxID=3095076 RepID=A0ABZ0ZRJ4_9ACTN|nr:MULTISPECIES: DUF3263 domain-containing protein [unclassified Nocardioides]MDZ5622578.1 DUF3263 domain-containing protein [Nocardioides sp. HM23]WQQ26847.1 DUF3263 domain-containing protein [Nocardioides sp. HM61]